MNRQETYNFDGSIDIVDMDTENAGGGNEIYQRDAFMQGIHQEIQAQSKPKEKTENYLDNDDDDLMESLLRAKKDVGLAFASEALHAGYNSDQETYAESMAVDAGMAESAADDNLILLDKLNIEPSPALSYSSIDYLPFNKDHVENSSISVMNEKDVSVAIRVSGFDVPRPIQRFEDCGFSAELMKTISEQAYEKPTSIQCHILPIVLSGRDVIGITRNDLGKFFAFLLPLIVHIMDQPELLNDEGPIGVICAPEDLARKIYLEAKELSKSHGIHVCAAFGRIAEIDRIASCDLFVGSPFRLTDLLRYTGLTISRATYLVLGDTDRMFSLGFEPYIRSIVGQIRSDFQTILFSASVPPKVEKLAREILTYPIRVTVGEVGMSNKDVTQIIEVIPSDSEKLPWILGKLGGLIDNGDVLIFASEKATVDMLESQLAARGFEVAAIHSDKTLKSGTFHVLIATDVAARGLDIKSIKSVVNFDVAKDMDMHAHRIGRTHGACDKDRTAYTLITTKEVQFAGELVNSLLVDGQNVPMELMDLAMKEEDGKYGKFRSKRVARKGGGKREKRKFLRRSRYVNEVDFSLKCL